MKSRVSDFSRNRHFSLLARSSAFALAAASVGTFLALAAAPPQEEVQGQSDVVVANQTADAQKVDFVRDIRPLLATHCYRCHGEDAQESGFRLDQKQSATQGGFAGDPAIVPGKPEESWLWRRISGAEPDYQMPPEGEPLKQSDVDLIKQWIAEGADWPDNADELEATSSHWAYNAPTRPELPSVTNATWANSALDLFVQEKLHSNKLQPSIAADRATIARRASLALVGVPPTLKELDAFLADDRPGAYERYVDRLLASPAFGERWAHMWLDLARYADSQGYEKDNRRVIWRYRDYVVDAFNADKPFDRFTIEQLAGDLLPDASTDLRLATAFHRNTMTNTEGGTDNEEFRVAAVVDRVNTTMEAWMGTTMGCAQCHTHKYDPITQREYYELFAFFNNTEDADVDDDRPRISTPTLNQRDRAAWYKARRAVLQEELERTETDEAKKPVEKQIAELDAVWQSPKTPILKELTGEKRRGTNILIRGSFLDKGDEVNEDVPAVFHDLRAGARRDRMSLARWLVDERNPLTARVTVNRVWEKLFGIGLVETTEDFGTQGEPPSHPELLDWLAVEFMDNGWSIKKLCKTIVTSSTYRQSSDFRADLANVDPLNRLLARGPRFRLPSEAVRDQALAVSGLLSRKIGGPSVMPPQPASVWEVVYSGDTWRTSGGDDKYRRALYTFWRRTSPYPSMMAFDSGSREFCISRRIRTNTPLQALVTLNDPAYMECAAALAAQAMQDGRATPVEYVRHAFRACLGRNPSDAEMWRVVGLFESELKHYREHAEDAAKLVSLLPEEYRRRLDPLRHAALTITVNMLMNLDEFFSPR